MYSVAIEVTIPNSSETISNLHFYNTCGSEIVHTIKSLNKSDAIRIDDIPVKFFEKFFK